MNAPILRRGRHRLAVLQLQVAQVRAQAVVVQTNVVCDLDEAGCKFHHGPLLSSRLQRGAVLILPILLNLVRDILRLLDQIRCQRRRSCEMEAVMAVFDGALDELVGVDQLVVLVASIMLKGTLDLEMEVLDVGIRVERRQLAKVRGKEAEGLGGQNGLAHRIAEPDAFVRAGAAPEFIDDDETAIGDILQDEAHFLALEHERRAVGLDAVVAAHAAEDVVHNAEAGILRRHKEADLGHDLQLCDLPQIHRLAAHVRTGDDDAVGATVYVHVIGDDLGTVLEGLQHRVDALLNGSCVGELWPHAVDEADHRGVGAVPQQIDHGNRLSEFVKVPNIFTQRSKEIVDGLAGQQENVLQTLIDAIVHLAEIGRRHG
eukprot:m.98551 g.98551  ORF g.98551 m.98551 type:complete len:373 (+) comp8696_c0_seq7:61-1179(+)